jgi:hypothetical protein
LWIAAAVVGLFSAADLAAATVYVGLPAAGGVYDLAERMAYQSWGDE